MNKIRFKPETDLTFKFVAAVRHGLNQVLLEDKAGDTFCMDLSEVKHCDSAGLALLIEARKACDRSKKVFEVVGISSEMQSLAEFCGVKSILESA